MRSRRFQLTHSRGVRLFTVPFTILVSDFNSRTHVECDKLIEIYVAIVKISTHALTWSATLNIVLKKDSPHSIWEFIAFYHQLS